MTWENVSGALTNLGTAMSTVFSSITENPILMLCVSVPVFTAACYAVKKLFKIAK